MTTEANSPGPAEARYREWIRSLGTLNPRQAALAEVLLSLAVQMDLATMRVRQYQEPTTAVATWARAALAATKELREADPTQAQPPVPAPDPAKDQQSEVARARAKRLGRTS